MKSKTGIIILLIATLILTLAGCGGQGDCLSKFEKSDMSGYDGLEGYEEELQFVDVTVKDIQAMMEAKETFAVFAGFSNCIWCNLMVSSLNDEAIKAGRLVGYLNTRAKPEWSNNLDIDDYDIFVEYFGDYLSIDDAGKPHLYTPDVYFVKNGVVVERHDGIVPGVDNPKDPLTEAQKKALADVYAQCFSAME